MIKFETSSVEGTRRIAEAIAGVVDNGDLVTLIGGLGAGKTAFTQGFALALGISDRVTSPTFALANRYEGRLVLNHLDVYRMDGAAESRDLGLDELLEQGVTVIEWADVILSALPDDRLDIAIGFSPGEDPGEASADDRRVLELKPLGRRWSDRVEELAAALADWTVAKDHPLRQASCETTYETARETRETPC